MSEQKEKGVSRFPEFTENPFIKNAITEVHDNTVRKYRNASNTGEKAILEAIDPNTGEVLGHTSFVRQIKVDEEKFVKLYMSGFQRFFNLSTAGIRMFCYFVNHIAIGRDVVIFDLQEALTYTRYTSTRSIYKGISELLAAGIIAKRDRAFQYFINPLCLFNGNRITYVDSYVKACDQEEQAAKHAKGVEAAQHMSELLEAETQALLSEKRGE